MCWLWRRVLLRLPRIQRSQRPRLQGGATLGEFIDKFWEQLELLVNFDARLEKYSLNRQRHPQTLPFFRIINFKNLKLYPPQLCPTNPCANGGTCWTSAESFYCACRPGFIGKLCEGLLKHRSALKFSEINFFLHALNWNFRWLQHWDRCKLEWTFVRYFLL